MNTIKTTQANFGLSDPKTTKGRIERAALGLFVERGIDGVSVKEIAQAANISDGGMYRHYPSKYKLAETLMLTIHNRLTDLVRNIEGDNTKLRIKVKALVVRYTALADEDWTLFAYHLLHLHHFPQLFTKQGRRKALDSPVSACADMLDAAIETGEIAPGNIQLLANMALGVVLQAAQAKTYGRLNGPLSIYTAEFDKAVWAIVKRK